MYRDAEFKVKYTSGIGVVIRYVPLAALFGGLIWAALYYEPFHQMITKETDGSPYGFVAIFAVFFIIISAEILLTLCKILLGFPALVITPDGIRGWNMWVPRYIAKTELAGVTRKKGVLEIHKTTEKILPQAGLFSRFLNPSHYLPGKIVIPLKAVDKSEAEIREALEALGFVGKYIYNN